MTLRPAGAYFVTVAARARAPLAACAAGLFFLIGSYAYPRNEPGGTYGMTALIGTVLAAWLVRSVLGAEPAEQADMAAVALGGRTQRLRLVAGLGACLAAILAVVFVLYPLVLLWAGDTHVFDPHPRVADVVAAVAAHVACLTFGATLGLLFAPPRVPGAPTAFAALTVTLLVVLVAGSALGPVGGPYAVADRMADARPGAISAGELVADASCLVLAAVAFGVADRWGRSRGG